jgi:hypothetical protein
MDNASKALVMAGAILIAVMLISLGVLLFNQGQNTAQQAGHLMDSTAIAAYNRQYTIYEGVNRTPSDAITLIGLVNANHANSQIVYDYGQIDLKSGSGYVNSTSSVDSQKLYTIKVEDYSSVNGAVILMSVVEQNGRV